MFVLINEIGKYEILGRTQDDAMGEAFDKVGRMLGLGYPAGALVETLAKDGTPGKVIFPVPMRQTKSGDTSFSGLKTAATRIIEPLKAAAEGTLTKVQICDVALGFQTACVTHLMEKLEFVLNQTPVNTLVLGGGVASNQALRTALRHKAKEHGIPFLLPYTKKLCTDNAAMIALAGNYKALRGEFETEIELLDRDPNLKLA
jgi:N6-L-threonylcarbamoyladenine synthase